MARRFTKLGAQRLIAPTTGRYALKDMSIAMRVYPEAAADAVFDTVLIGYTNDNGAAPTSGWCIKVQGGAPTAIFKSGFSVDPIRGQMNTQLAAGSWYHLVLRCKDITNPANGPDWYVNGVFDAGTNMVGSGTYTAPYQPLAIGNDPQPSPVQGFQGLIESVGIWNRIITPGEVNGLWNGMPPDSFPIGLVSHFDLAGQLGPVRDTVDGIVLAEQGTMAAVASIWPTRMTQYPRPSFRRARLGTPIAVGGGGSFGSLLSDTLNLIVRE